MPSAARLSDIALVNGDAHGCSVCPHVASGPIISASVNVFINGLGAARKGDPGIHAVCCGPNTFTINAGSDNVYVNGKPLARMQDETKHCGGNGKIIAGSPTVNCN